METVESAGGFCGHLGFFNKALALGPNFPEIYSICKKVIIAKGGNSLGIIIGTHQRD